MQVEFADGGWKAVRIANRSRSTSVMELQTISRDFLDPWNEDLKQPGRIDLLQRDRTPPADERFNLLCIRPEDTDCQTIVLQLWAKDLLVRHGGHRCRL